MAAAFTELPEAGAAAGMLRDLDAALTRAGGYSARLVAGSGGVPALVVTNASEATLSETVRAVQRDGAWVYLWSWGEPIPGGAVEVAARIRRVLRAVP